MNIIVYIKEVPFFKKFLGCSIIFLSLIILFSNVVFGMIFLVIGLNLLSSEGSEINLESNTYRNIKSIFNFSFGKWKPCPEFEYVSVFKTKENQTIRVVTAEATVQSEIILINLFYNTNKHITFYKTKDLTDAFKVAEKFKSFFNIDIFDATTNDHKWL